MPAAAEDIRVDDRRAHIPVPEPFLDSPDVVTRFEQMGRERMP